MKTYRPYRFPPLAQFASAEPQSSVGGPSQSALAEGFRQGMDQGYREGHESGVADGYREGLDQGRSEGLHRGVEEGRGETLVSFEALARPLDAMLKTLKRLQADYQQAQRKEVVELVAKVARQVMRAEIASQPEQLLAMVDETLSTMPATRDAIEVYLNPGELELIKKLDSKRAARWKLIPDPRLEPGECRVKAGHHEADAGCQQRLAACMEQVGAQLLESSEHAEAAA
ncbi:MAG TPA: flagellar assembly protein FliH [Burkholderiaceae bacterium]|jgi:flagellar assembly protein FliH